MVEQLRIDAASVVNATSREVLRELKDKANKSVQMFYEAYESPDYERTWGLYTVYKPVDTGAGTNREVGVEFSPSYIMTEHKISDEMVYGTAWEEGYHGNPDYPGTYQTASPKLFMDMSFMNLLPRISKIIQRNCRTYFN